MGLLLYFTGLDYTAQESEENMGGKVGGNSDVRAFAVLCISMCLAGFVYRGQTLLLVVNNGIIIAITGKKQTAENRTP